MKDVEPLHNGSDDEQAFRIAYLIAGFIKDNLTEKEHNELDEWVSASMTNQRLFEDLTDEGNLDRLMQWKQQLKVDDRLQTAKQKLGMAQQKPRRLGFLPYAAIALIFICFASIVFYEKRNIENLKDLKVNKPVAMDIAPGGNKAILTLANGLNIMLDSAHDGNLAQQGNIIIKKDSGLINYQLTAAAKSPVATGFNSLSTPKGGQYKIILPDGTKVWLNAASSLRYPTAFVAAARSIELSGEAYFEVAKDAAHPFVVTANNTSVMVLGTHFNVNAYPDENKVDVTLAEGSVRVNQSVTIKPGQQAQVNANGEIKIVQADMETIFAWKDGLFVFKETPVGEVMKQITRWYDAEVVYQANNSEHFNATIPRDVPASQLLHFLEGTGRVHFRIEDKKITVMK